MVFNFVADCFTPRFTDFARRNAHMWHIFNRLSVRINKAVINRHELKIIGGGFCYNARPKLNVGSADNYALHTLCTEIIKRSLHFFSVLSANFYQCKAFFLCSYICKFPFILKPWLFWLLNDKSNFYIGSQSGGRAG